MDQRHTSVLVPKFEKFEAVEIAPGWTKKREDGLVREECAISGKVVEGGNGIPIIDEKPGYICDNQGAYANFQQLGVHEIMELGHIPRSTWTGRR